jgi:DNA-binding NarL/FixJ family response regulator
LVRIFLVDDNAKVRSQLRTALEKQRDWVVVGEAENGKRAIERWGENHPDLTVMDFVMPQMDGLEAGRRLSQQHPDSPVLMVTIDPSPQLEQEAKKAGIRGLCKKSDLRCLFAAIEALIKGRTYFHISHATA